MPDTLSLLKERLDKAEAKAARARKAWDSAEAEVCNLRIAWQVIREINGEILAQPAANSTAERQTLILNMLGVEQLESKSPAELFEAYRLLAEEDINIDTFRTTLWRMRDQSFRRDQDTWLVKGEAGQYWKVPGTFETRQRYEAAEKPTALADQPEDESDVYHRRRALNLDDDLDPDVPF